MPSVLIVLSSARVWTMKNGSPHPTGFWAREFVEAHETFVKAGFNVTIATSGGLTPAVDPLSLALSYNDNLASAVEAQKAYIAKNQAAIDAPKRLEDANAADYDVVFVVGGHGPMQDLAVHPTFGGLLRDMLKSPNKIVGAVCHGIAAFLPADDGNGNWLFAGRKLTGFSNEEETMATFAGNAPWLLEDRLRLAGAQYIAAKAYTQHVVVDGNVVTGQQNVSSGAAAEAILEQLKVAR